MLNLIELPPNWKAFEQAATGLTTFRPNVPSLSHFEIVRGAVVAKPSLKAWIDSKTQDTITHPKHIKAYRDAEKLIGQIQDFQDAYGVRVFDKEGGIFTFGKAISRDEYDYGYVNFNKTKIKNIKTND